MAKYIDEVGTKEIFKLTKNYTDANLGISGSSTLLASGWSNNAYTLTISTLGTNDAIFFSPSTLADKTNMESSNIITSTSGSTVTFSAISTPMVDIVLNYFITKGRA